jgi:hypothetical protein
MPGILVQIIFGWPVILLSLAVSVAGILKKRSWLLVVGGVLCVPFTLYLSGWPGIRFLAFLLPVFQLGAAWAVHGNRKAIAWSLLLPLASVIVILAIIVLTQSYP